MIIKNKYYLIYCNIILKVKQEKRTKKGEIFYESHHIFPKSIYPKYKKIKRNIILLTPKEHYICHHLLTKFTTGKAKSLMIFAFWGMNNQLTLNRQYKITTIIYTKIKQYHANEISKLRTGLKHTQKTKDKISKANTGKRRSEIFKKNRKEAMLGEKNPNFGKPGTWTDRKHTQNELKKMSESHLGEKNYKFIGYYVTPFGKYPSIKRDIHPLCPDPGTIRRWCKDVNRIISASAYRQNMYLNSLNENIIGKTFKNIGFWFEPM